MSTVIPDCTAELWKVRELEAPRTSDSRRGEELIMWWFVERLYKGQGPSTPYPERWLPLPYPRRRKEVYFLTKFNLRWSPADGFDLWFFNIMVVQKENSFSRNCISDFDLFPGYQHAPWYSLTHELRRTQKSQNNLEEVQSWRTTTLFQILRYSYSKQHV